MAKLADSEATIWKLAGKVQQLREEYAGLQKVLVVLLRRDSSARTVVTAEELINLPPGVALHSAGLPDGGFSLWVTDEPEQPGNAG
jgi:hypothetical protein